ncbi:Ig-like domain-containing protein [Neobacillus niacini]|uniref:Ig-like domain-containing protein n=1 Tax=Neobacillus niacini TaxID=86668 RepID=UPI001C8CF53B|nr:Ig-like domain-containing protein [Neobacillus niacini]MBY0146351.1 Ig-like domain-containing protein [Neobacillus niacini]
MRYRGLLHKTKFQVLVVLVLCIQLIGQPQISPLLSVKSEELEPTITITTPESGISLSEEDIVISGTAENFPPEALINLYIDEMVMETPIQVIDNMWSVQLSLTKGSHSILAKTEIAGNQISSEPIEFTIVPVLPNMIITKPISGEYVNEKALEGSTKPSATVKICMDCTKDSDDVISGSWSSVQADSTGKWVYQNLELAEGNHTAYAQAIDGKGYTSEVAKVTFIVDSLRPNVLPDVFPKQDMTQVSLNPVIKVKISDANALNEAEIKNSINVSQNGANVKGATSFNKDTKEITFTPLEALTPSKKYNVFISPLGIIDAAKNSAFPRFWSFTTVGIKSDIHQNPHGSYTNNVDTCGNCHSTHNAQNANLLTPKTESETNLAGGGSSPEAETYQSKDLAADSFCMACHDGTVVAPLPENSKANHTHDAAIKIDGTPSGSSCGSCHNPHLDRSENNPNMAQDHITYTHQPSSPVDPNKPTEEISSKEQLCESCHENDSAEKIAHEDVEYTVFKYSKSSTATGIYEDYELCLRCHNEEFKSKYNKSADIASHYNNLTEEIMKQYEKMNGPSSFANREISAAEKNFSGHIIKAMDGSPLAGHLPCAECHDTHGSNNLKQLKNSFGHENAQSFTAGDTDSKNVKVVTDNNKVEEFSILTDSKEREFCMACHNGTTAIYGVTGEKYDIERSEHKAYPTESCSYCHGRGESEGEKALSAAHAPKKGLIPR